MRSPKAFWVALMPSLFEYVSHISFVCYISCATYPSCFETQPNIGRWISRRRVKRVHEKQRIMDSRGLEGLMQYVAEQGLESALRGALARALRERPSEPVAAVGKWLIEQGQATAAPSASSAPELSEQQAALLGELSALLSTDPIPKGTASEESRGPDACDTEPARSQPASVAEHEQVHFTTERGCLMTIRVHSRRIGRRTDARLAVYAKPAGEEEVCDEANVRGVELSGDWEFGAGVHEHNLIITGVGTPPSPECAAMLAQLLPLATRAGVTARGFESVKGFGAYAEAKEAREKATQDRSTGPAVAAQETELKQSDTSAEGFVRFTNVVRGQPFTATLRLTNGQLGWYVTPPGEEDICFEENLRCLGLSHSSSGQRITVPGHNRLSEVPDLIEPSGAERDLLFEQLLSLAALAGVKLTGFGHVAGFDKYERAMTAADERAEAARAQVSATAFAKSEPARLELKAIVEERVAGWRSGVGADSDHNERNAHQRLVESEEIAARDDWRELFEEPMTGAGCPITKTEERGITLAQLRAVKANISRRCTEQGWATWTGQPLTPAAVSLYDTAKYIILPATVAQQCSFVELVAREAQSPHWFVSHWWGEPVFDFISCLEQHTKDNQSSWMGGMMGGGTGRTGTNYWVCAYANNQWALGDALTDDPGQTSFHKAMALAEGTVSVVDKEGIVFTRIWCMPSNLLAK